MGSVVGEGHGLGTPQQSSWDGRRYLDLQSTQHNGLHPRGPGRWHAKLRYSGTLGVLLLTVYLRPCYSPKRLLWQRRQPAHSGQTRPRSCHAELAAIGAETLAQGLLQTEQSITTAKPNEKCDQFFFFFVFFFVCVCVCLLSCSCFEWQ